MDNASNGQCNISSFPSIIGTLPVTTASISGGKQGSGAAGPLEQDSNIKKDPNAGLEVEDNDRDFFSIDPIILLIVLAIDLLLIITGYFGHRLDVREGRDGSKNEQTKLVTQGHEWRVYDRALDESSRNMSAALA